jgi:ABC-type multidrug transport system permease subunit
MNRLNAKYAPIVFAAIMSIIMAGFMSAVVTAINTGLEDGFVTRWLMAYVKVLPIAFVAIVLLRPIAQKLTALIVQSAK